MHYHPWLPVACGTVALALSLSATPVHAELVFDFESASPLSSPAVGGDRQNFIVTTEQGHNGSSSSLKFADPSPEPYESFSYDVPFDTFTSGVISVWFYDTRGPYNTGHGAAKSGGAIILEDRNNRQDFVAVEALTYPYGLGGVSVPAYYGSEGSTDRLKPNDRFDIANFPPRTIGFHKVEFHVTPAETKVFVDGKQSLEVAGPGSTSQLSLRFMADSPSNGGSATDNWITKPNAKSAYAGGEWLYFDDIKFQRELPSAATLAQDFEITAGTPEYDVAGEAASPGSPGVIPHDNPLMHTFVNQWNVSTSPTAAHSGTQSAYFANATPPLRSITFDLAEALPGTTVSLYFYDALGQNADFDQDNSIILENADDPAEFIALEVNNWPYPYGAPLKNYYLTESTGGPAPVTDLFSDTFPARSIGWHKAEFVLHADHSELLLDGVPARRNKPGNHTGVMAAGPGLAKNLRLRLMADDASQGGYSNWTQVNELTAGYRVSTRPYVYYDDIRLPIPANASVPDWNLY